MVADERAWHLSIPISRHGVWSRRIVGWKVANRESAELAAEFIIEVCLDRQLDPQGLVLHSDNGKPMRGSTMISTLQWPGVVPSFNRPHVSDDNPYSVSLFRTLKHTPAYPRCRSQTVRLPGDGSSAS